MNNALYFFPIHPLICEITLNVLFYLYIVVLIFYCDDWYLDVDINNAVSKLLVDNQFLGRISFCLLFHCQASRLNSFSVMKSLQFL